MQQGERRTKCVEEVGSPRKEDGRRPETQSSSLRTDVSLRPQRAPVRGPDHRRAVAQAESSPAQARVWRERKDGTDGLTLELLARLGRVETAHVKAGSTLPIYGVSATFVTDSPVFWAVFRQETAHLLLCQ
jgi:hypothetical protein